MHWNEISQEIPNFLPRVECFRHTGRRFQITCHANFDAQNRGRPADPGSEDWTEQHSSLSSSSSRAAPVSPLEAHHQRGSEQAQAGAAKMQVSRGRYFPFRANRSRCHEAVFNRISPSLLDIFHDSREVSHFLDEVPTSSCGQWDLNSSAEESPNLMKLQSFYELRHMF